MIVQSINDVITNSSSETFLAIHSDTLDSVKEICTSLIGLGMDSEEAALLGRSPEFDDYFTIEVNWRDKEAAEEAWDEEGNVGTLEEFAIKMDSEDSDHYPYLNGFTVKAKSPEYEKVAEKVNKMNDLFNATEYYC